MTRAVPALPLLLLLAACNAAPSGACPGDAVAAFDFTGTQARAGDLGAGLDPVPAVSDCPQAVGFPAAIGFSGTLTAIGASGAALCRQGATNLTGTRADSRWTVRSESSGAVLGGCGATCTAGSRVTVTGDLTPDATAPTGFSGAVVEELSFDAGDCGSCALPCAGRYVLTRKEAP